MAGALMPMATLIDYIDEKIRFYNGREAVTYREFSDSLLDIRLACTAIIEQRSLDASTDGIELPQGFDLESGSDPDSGRPVRSSSINDEVGGEPPQVLPGPQATAESGPQVP